MNLKNLRPALTVSAMGPCRMAAVRNLQQRLECGAQGLEHAPSSATDLHLHDLEKETKTSENQYSDGTETKGKTTISLLCQVSHPSWLRRRRRCNKGGSKGRCTRGRSNGRCCCSPGLLLLRVFALFALFALCLLLKIEKNSSCSGTTLVFILLQIAGPDMSFFSGNSFSLYSLVATQRQPFLRRVAVKVGLSPFCSSVDLEEKESSASTTFSLPLPSTAKLSAGEGKKERVCAPFY